MTGANERKCGRKVYWSYILCLEKYAIFSGLFLKIIRTEIMKFRISQIAICCISVLDEYIIVIHYSEGTRKFYFLQNFKPGLVLTLPPIQCVSGVKWPEHKAGRCKWKQAVINETGKSCIPHCVNLQSHAGCMVVFRGCYLTDSYYLSDSSVFIKPVHKM